MAIFLKTKEGKKLVIRCCSYTTDPVNSLKKPKTFLEGRSRNMFSTLATLLKL